MEETKESVETTAVQENENSSLLNDIIVFCLAVLGGQEISQASNKWLWGHP